MKKQYNIIGWILFGIGIIFLMVGIIASNQAMQYYEPGLSNRLNLFFSEFTYWFIIGMVFIAFSEIIKLLHRIYYYIPPVISKVEDIDKKRMSQGNEEEQLNVPVSSWSFSHIEKEKIYDLYNDETILNIIPSHLQGYCIVNTKNGEGEDMRIVDVGGFGAHEVYNEEIIGEIMSWYKSQNKL